MGLGGSDVKLSYILDIEYDDPLNLPQVVDDLLPNLTAELEAEIIHFTHLQNVKVRYKELENVVCNN